MPDLDRKGPLGQGPKTGRGEGRCSRTNWGPVKDTGLADDIPRRDTTRQRLRDGTGAGLGRRRGRCRFQMPARD